MPRGRSKPRSKRKASGKSDKFSSSFHDDNVLMEPSSLDDVYEDVSDDDDDDIDIVSDADIDDEASAKGNGSGGFNNIAVPEFTPDEFPLMGYALASFVFFLAAVTRKAKNAPSSSSSLSSSTTPPIPGLDFNDILGDSYGDTAADFDDNTFTDGDSAALLSRSIVEQCEAAYNDICGTSNLFVDAMGGYGSKLATGHFAYAMCLGIFGTLMGAGLIAWKRAAGSGNGANRSEGRASIVDDGGDATESGDDDDDDDRPKSGVFLKRYGWLINGVLLLWAGVGWAFFTFGGNDVFAYTGNGFFALWAMLLCAVWNFGITVDEVVQKSESVKSCIYALTATSVVQIIELTTGLNGLRYAGNKGISAYALVVSIIAILFGLLTAGFSVLAARTGAADLDAKITFWYVLVVFVLSILAAFLTTFVGPFLTTGNGYFAVWGSVLFSGLAFSKLRNDVRRD